MASVMERGLLADLSELELSRTSEVRIDYGPGGSGPMAEL